MSNFGDVKHIQPSEYQRFRDGLAGLGVNVSAASHSAAVPPGAATPATPVAPMTPLTRAAHTTLSNVESDNSRGTKESQKIAAALSEVAHLLGVYGTPYAKLLIDELDAVVLRVSDAFRKSPEYAAECAREAKQMFRDGLKSFNDNVENGMCCALLASGKTKGGSCRNRATLKFAYTSSGRVALLTNAYDTSHNVGLCGTHKTFVKRLSPKERPLMLRGNYGSAPYNGPCDYYTGDADDLPQFKTFAQFKAHLQAVVAGVPHVPATPSFTATATATAAAPKIATVPEMSQAEIEHAMRVVASYQQQNKAHAAASATGHSLLGAASPKAMMV